MLGFWSVWSFVLTVNTQNRVFVIDLGYTYTKESRNVCMYVVLMTVRVLFQNRFLKSTRCNTMYLHHIWLKKFTISLTYLHLLTWSQLHIGNVIKKNFFESNFRTWCISFLFRNVGSNAKNIRQLVPIFVFEEKCLIHRKFCRLSPRLSPIVEVLPGIK